MESTVEGPGSISFWWKVSSENGYDYLTFYIDNVEQAKISGSVSWQNELFNLGTGVHTVAWIYEKDVSVSRGSDAGWVDQVGLVAGTSRTNAGLPWLQLLLDE